MGEARISCGPPSVRLYSERNDHLQPPRAENSSRISHVLAVYYRRHGGKALDPPALLALRNVKNHSHRSR
ncbi:hypothetical protein C8035_v002157 [Colletotrichum spinosum]|uniref:Uncharacterized protein n=1 Tax=Colletotrichum spinosum TaxID=1347390 RepID=A0A4R8QL99_9PEZI|nr:hypothetical protein C8035_v002157 [Colletotrichum spinosum]